MPYVTTGTYDKALVSYIDLLGFAELINDSLSNPLNVAKIASLLTTMKEEFSAGARVHRDAKERVV